MRYTFHKWFNINDFCQTMTDISTVATVVSATYTLIPLMYIYLLARSLNIYMCFWFMFCSLCIKFLFLVSDDSGVEKKDHN